MTFLSLFPKILLGDTRIPPSHLLGEILKFRDFSDIFNTHKVMPRPRHLRPLLSTGTINIIKKIHSC